MMDDHFIISEARNQLADALKALLRADIMTDADFQRSQRHTKAALSALDKLVKPSGWQDDPLKGSWWMTPFLWLWFLFDRR